MNKLGNFQNGLVLFEILIIIALIALLAIASYVGFKSSLKKSRDSVRKADLEEIKGVVYDFYMDTDCFPDQLPGCGGELKKGNVAYKDNFPCDPNGKEYEYQTEGSGCSQWFKVLTNLENEEDFSIEKVGCSHGCGLNCDYNYGLSSSNVKLNQGCVTYYACSPSGNCIAFEDPQASQCPIVFENEPDCRNVCNERANRCHDERGRRVPD